MKIMQLKTNEYQKNEIIQVIWEWTELIQEEFAKSINRGKRTVQVYECGETNYSLDMFFKICEMYNIEILIRKKLDKI